MPFSPRFRPGSAARLRGQLLVMFLLLAVPAALLVRQGFVRLEFEEFRRQQLIAESVVRRIDAALSAAIAVENARPAADFQFARSPAAGDVVQLSPLSSIAAAAAFPGAIGYFEVDPAGQLSTPLLPENETERESIEDFQLREKVAVIRNIADVLEANQLVSASQLSLPAAAEQARLEQTSLERVAAEAGDAAPAARAAAPAFADTNAGAGSRADADGIADAGAAADRGAADRAAADRSTLETSVGQLGFDRLDEARLRRQSVAREEAPAATLPTAAEPESAEADRAALSTLRVSSFAGEIEPLRLSLLESDHIVLFRNAWRDGQRFVQGLLVDRAGLVRQSVVPEFIEAGFADGTVLTVAVEGEIAETFGAVGAGSSMRPGFPHVSGDGLLSARLSPPLSDIELAFTAGALDRGPGFSLLVWTSIALAAVLVGGFVSMYRFGMGQLKLAREQRNFVSAVSHELKTPLTSIRMYGEMLKSGWADDEKRQRYYDFIVDEGERLSRLIENVLVLSRLNNGGAAVRPERIEVGELFDLLRSKLASQAERAGFALEFDLPDTESAIAIAVDADALTQVFINLVDNAIKFSGESERRQVVIAARRRGSELLLTVRDFGPGIPAAALKRLFELFYRPDNELTRATTGTGIGLALVRELVTAMAGRIDVRNCEPGAEFRLSFPVAA